MTVVYSHINLVNPYKSRVFATLKKVLKKVFKKYTHKGKIFASLSLAIFPLCKKQQSSIVCVFLKFFLPFLDPFQISPLTPYPRSPRKVSPNGFPAGQKKAPVGAVGFRSI
jgi:hypothetical protein